jgi:hypothetical protein
VWVDAEYLLWWTKGEHLPPLVTAGTLQKLTHLDQPGTAILYGEGNVNSEVRSGGRFSAGFWLDECQTKGLEVSYFFLAPRSDEFTVTSGWAGSAAIGRPFFDPVSRHDTAELIAFPGVVRPGKTTLFPGLALGSGTVSATSRLQGAEANALCSLCCCDGYRVDLVGGFRYLNLQEGLIITENTEVTNPHAVGGLMFSARQVLDGFSTANNFYGGQIGLRGEVWRGRLFANARALVALGTTHEQVSIAGDTLTVWSPGQAAEWALGGLLAKRTNIGGYSRDCFSAVPEVGFHAGYQIGAHLRAYAGYTLLYWSDVARPGDEIDLVVNPAQVRTAKQYGGTLPPALARPAFSFNGTDFWAQGIDFGLELRF